MENLNQFINQYFIPWGINIVSALIVFVVGRWVSRIIVNVLDRVMTKADVDIILKKFLSNVFYTALLVMVVIMALGELGVNTTSVLAIFGAAGLAIGLALKDTLSNFAAGVMLIIFKPFKVGNFVEAGGQKGIVDAISVFSTKMHTPDNIEITIPNAQIYGGTIVNISAFETRRIDLVIGIGYDDNIGQAKALISQIIDANEHILQDPATFVGLVELADSSVNLAIRTWVKAVNFGVTRCDLLEKIKESFDTNGISFPYPQQDVHMYKTEKEAA